MEHKKPGRPSRGDRAQLNVWQPRALYEAAKAKAAQQGMTVTDYIGLLMAADLDMPYDAQEALSLSA